MKYEYETLRKELKLDADGEVELNKIEFEQGRLNSRLERLVAIYRKG